MSLGAWCHFRGGSDGNGEWLEVWRGVVGMAEKL